jgi:hypothetical protein
MRNPTASAICGRPSAAARTVSNALTRKPEAEKIPPDIPYGPKASQQIGGNAAEDQDIREEI